MYMLVFVTLVVALLGTYTQIYTKQAMRMFSQQSAAAAAMMAWNATAVSLANHLLTSAPLVGSSAATPTATSGGCMLTDVSAYNGTNLSNCLTTSGVKIYVTTPNNTSYAACNRNQSDPCWTDLPTGYYYSHYPFYTVAFQGVLGAATNQYYVLTFVPPPPTTSAATDLTGLDLLCLPGMLTGTSCSYQQSSITFTDLYRQLRQNPAASPLSYGTVTVVGTTHYLVTPTVVFGSSSTLSASSYVVPSFVPSGSIGIITLVTLCSSC